ncbi:MAG: DUF1559 domain-containing protein [Gemmataceae bacterium]|nr:DUF1559 domain-containing protein [Gemmataceae bacterium]
MRYVCRTGCRPAGFSLVELVVVLAIIGVVVALTGAAVQRVRAAAARTACANQLRQLSLALHNYQAQRGAFPPGVRDDRDKAEPYPFLSFHARLLPYLEQQARWAETETAFRTVKDFLVDPPHTGLSTAMPQFGCPLDARTRDPQPVRGKEPYRGLTSYLGVEGTRSAKEDGVLYVNSRVRPTDIGDGLSNTLALGERPPSDDHLFGWWYGGWGQERDGECDMLLGTRVKANGSWGRGDCPKGPYHFQPGDLRNPCAIYHFWSLHPGGAHFAFADGSVRFLAYSADEIMPALSTRAGGEAVTPP